MNQLQFLVIIALMSFAYQPACASPLPAPQNDIPLPPPPPSPPPTRWPPSTPPKPPANGKTGHFPFGHYYPTVTVIGVPRAVFGIPTQSSGPKGEDGCLYYRIDTNELVDDLWAPVCDPAAKYWWFTALLWIICIVAVICSPWILLYSFVGLMAARDLYKRQKRRVKTAVRDSQLFRRRPSPTTELQVSSTHPATPAAAPTPAPTAAAPATANATTTVSDPLLPDYGDSVVIRLRPRARAAASGPSSLTALHGHGFSLPSSSSSSAPMASVREARFAKAYLTANPHARLYLTPADLDLMTDPSSWTFRLPSDTDTVLLSANLSVDDKSITIRPTSSLASTHKFTAISLLTNLPVPWFPADAEIGPPTSAGPSIRYFEVTIIQLDALACTLAIGLSTAPYPYFGLPGLYPWSIALHSRDGSVYSSVDGESTPASAPYAQKPIRAGDTVSVGLDTASGGVFFTRNGSRLRTVEAAHVPRPEQWMVKPCVGVSVNGPGGAGDEWEGVEPCVLRWNFGTSEFAWSEGQGMGYGVETEPPAYTLEVSCEGPGE